MDGPAASTPLGSARDRLVTDVPRADADVRAGDLRARMTGRTYGTATEVAVVDAGRLLGVVPIERLLGAAEDVVVRTLALPLPVVALDDDLEAAARNAASRGARNVAVVDGDGAFAGFVPGEALLRVLEFEHEEDMARLGGFRSRAAEARRASEEPVPRRLWHRLPWLGIGLAGAMASAAIVGAFEEELERQVLLALFVPAVVYMADAVGTQTETLVIRGMSLGVRIRDILARELVTGLVVGALIGMLFFPFALGVWGDARVAGTVALALVVSCSVATLVAMTLPALLARLGRDPAFGSGPLATVIQDLLSIVAYFAIAVALAP